MQVGIMEKVLDTLNRQMIKEGRNVILFLDNATVHPPSLIDMYSNIKIVFPSEEYHVTFAASRCWYYSKLQIEVSKEVDAPRDCSCKG